MPSGRRWRGLLLDVTPLRESADFRRLWAGMSLSALGTRMTQIAIPFEVYRLTHSTLLVGILGFARLVPNLALSLLGGAYADAHDRRRIMIATQLGGALCSIGLFLNSRLWSPSVPAIFVLALVGASCFSIQSPAERSSIPRFVRPDQLVAAMVIKQGTASAAFLAGPAIGGVLIAAGGPSWVYGADVASYALGMIAILRLSRLLPEPHMSGAKPFAAVVDGLRRLRGRDALIGSFVADLNAMVFGLPVALFPALVDRRYGGSATVYGLFMSAPLAGAVVASVVSGWTRRIHRHGMAVTALVAVWGGAIAGFGLVSDLVAGLALLAVAGWADAASGVFRHAMLQRSTPPEMLGRMEGVGMAVWSGGPALGDLEAGVVAATAGVTASIVSGGILCVVGSLVIVAALPGFRRYDDRAGSASG